MAYFKLEPRVSIRRDYNAAQLMQQMYDLNRDPRKSESKKVEEFLLKFEEKRKQTWQEQKAFFLEWAGVPEELRKKPKAK